jgi:hypothetical protein
VKALKYNSGYHSNKLLGYAWGNRKVELVGDDRSVVFGKKKFLVIKEV